MKLILCFLALFSTSFNEIDDMYKVGDAELWDNWDGYLYIKFQDHWYKVIHLEHDLNVCSCIP
jgi:hypothetical protein